MKSLKTLLLPKHFFTLPVFISIYSWLNYVHLLDFTNNQGGRYLTRIVILTLLFLFTIGLLYIVSKLIVERISINYAYIVFFAFIIAALCEKTTSEVLALCLSLRIGASP
jgi:hypothetical protein